MKSREQEYKEIFIAEALEYYDALSRHISDLEKDPQDEPLLAEIFRLLHNLKANAKAIGYLKIAELSHKLETAFGLIRNKEMTFQNEVVSVLFDGVDSLGELIRNVDNQDYKTSNEAVLQNLDIIVDNVKNKNPTGLKKVEKYYSSKNLSLSDLVYIQIKKLDHMMNLIGELIIDRDRILSLAKEVNNPELKAISSHLYRISEDLQYSVMDARLVNIGTLFNKFPRVVRDVSVSENKKVNLQLSGLDIQIDRNILQIITDSLLHLVRNAINHGIETPNERSQKGKPEEGTLTLSARNDRDTVVIKLKDDGKGIDYKEIRKAIISQKLLTPDKARDLRDTEVLSFLFEPGFSLAKEVTEYSGRGVGLDVVKTAIDSIGGRIKIDSEKGSGTTFTLYLPTSIAVKGALLFEIEGSTFAIPLIHTDSVIALPKNEIHEVGDVLIANIKNETITLINMREMLNKDNYRDYIGDKSLLTGDLQDIVIVSYNNRKLGLIVDKLVRQQDIVIKALNKPLDNIDIYGGVTLLGSGKICLVLDVPSLTRYFIARK